MAMQTDVKSAHLNVSGQMVPFRARLKGIIGMGTATAGTVNFWDTTTAPVAMTYARSTNVVTVTLNNHGLTTGQVVGLTFGLDGSGRSATNGNYAVTVTGTNTYTVVDINSGTVSSGTAGTQGTKWMASFDTNTASDVTTLLIPGEGMLAENGIYCQMTNQTAVTVFYG